MPSLTMLTGDCPGKVFRLDNDEMVIGKKTDCDIILPDRHVSKSHARIVRRPDGLYVENLREHEQDEGQRRAVDGAPPLGRW